VLAEIDTASALRLLVLNKIDKLEVVWTPVSNRSDR